MNASKYIVLMLFTVLAMPTASAIEYYLLPDNSSVANPGDCTTVSVTLNATEICCNTTTPPCQTVLKFDTGRDDVVTSLDTLMTLQAVDQEG